MAARICRSCSKPLTGMAPRCPECGTWWPIGGLVGIQLAAAVFLAVVFLIAIALLMTLPVPRMPGH